MIIRALTVGFLGTNCYLIGDELSHEGAAIDPGGDPDLILTVLRTEGLVLRYILNTHAHFDHIAANEALLEATGALLALHPADGALLAAGGGGSWFGLPGVSSRRPDVELSDGQELVIGGLRLQVLHTPGHSPGHVAFYLPQEKVCFSGDALFRQGIGRTDLPGGNYAQLEASLRHRLLVLPDTVIVYPGHGPPTTIGEERRDNPFLSSQGRTSRTP